MTHSIVLMLWRYWYGFSLNVHTLQCIWNGKKKWTCIPDDELWAAIQGKGLFFFHAVPVKMSYWLFMFISCSSDQLHSAFQPQVDLKLILSFALHAPFSRGKGFTNKKQALINIAPHVQIIFSSTSLCCAMHYNWSGLCKCLPVCWWCIDKTGYCLPTCLWGMSQQIPIKWFI